MIISHFPGGEAKTFVRTGLDANSWDTISKIASEGTAASYWAVGDTKEIIINGTVGNTKFDNLSVWAFIIGFNHNSSVEGENTIHFQIGKSAQTGGTDICLVDYNYGAQVSSAGFFSMNYSTSNSGGWSKCKMRGELLGSTYTADNPLPDSLQAALPYELCSVMKIIKKFSDNAGSQSWFESSVTATSDNLWLLSEFELIGTTTKANPYEKKHQEQYAYYANGNPKKFYKHSDPDVPAGYWLRSVNQSMASFCDMTSTGSLNDYYANYSLGICPCFCV